MKLSSTSLIAAALAALAGSASAAPAPRPLDQDLFGRGVVIYNRGYPVHPYDHKTLAVHLHHAADINDHAAEYADQKQWSEPFARHAIDAQSLRKLAKLHEEHPAEVATKIEAHKKFADEKLREAYLFLHPPPPPQSRKM